MVRFDDFDEGKLAANASYRNTRMDEFAKIIRVAKEVCQAEGHSEAVPHLDTIMVGGGLLMVAWPALRPNLEGNAAAKFACSVMLVACWTTPQSAIRRFGLQEQKGNDTDRDVLNLISITASSLRQILEKMGIPLR